MKRFTIFATLAMLLAVGSATSRRSTLSNSVDLVGSSWHLLELPGQELSVEASQDSFTLEFLPDGVVSGRGACNRLSGQYQLLAVGKLQIGPLALTRMMCPDMELEMAYIAAVGSAVSYQIADGYLVLLNGEKPIAKFYRK